MSELVAVIDRWENLPFLVSFVVGAVFMVLQFLGFGLDSLLGLGGAEAGVDADADVDLDVDVDVDVHADVGLDADADLSGDAGVHPHTDLGDVGGGGHPGLLSALLNWFNVGKAPFMVIFQTFLLGFGAFGAAGTTLLTSHHELSGGRALVYAVPFALSGAAIATKLMGGLFARFLPTFETKPSGPGTLLGRTGRVISGRVDGRTGRVSVRDGYGDLHQVFCRSEEGAPPIERGAEVVLARHVPADKVFVVHPAPAEASGEAG